MRRGARVLGVTVGAVALAAPLVGLTGHPAASGSPTVTVSGSAGRAVPARYEGFSMETGNLCYLVSLAASHSAVVQLFRNVGPGWLRVGGVTGEYGQWNPAGTASCGASSSTITEALVNSVFGLAHSMGDNVSWQVPLRVYNPAAAAAEAAYVAAKRGASIAIGNEPNKYPNATANYPAIISEWNTVAADYRADGGRAPLSGPGVDAGATWYLQDFLAADRSRVSSLTVHLYAGKAGTNPPPSCPQLVTSMARLRSPTAAAVSVAAAAKLPLVMEETNTYYGHGQPGVSNAFCSALWAADYLLTGLDVGVAGMDFHGPVNYPPGNSLGALEYYTPINSDGTPAPEYYGMLFAHRVLAGGGHQLATTASGATGLDSHAVLGSDGTLRLALINTGASAMTVAVNTARSYATAAAISLAAPSLTSLSGVTLGGAAVAANGTWAPAHTQPVAVAGTHSSVSVPAYSAVEVTYRP